MFKDEERNIIFLIFVFRNLQKKKYIKDEKNDKMFKNLKNIWRYELTIHCSSPYENLSLTKNNIEQSVVLNFYYRSRMPHYIQLQCYTEKRGSKIHLFTTYLLFAYVWSWIVAGKRENNVEVLSLNELRN